MEYLNHCKNLNELRNEYRRLAFIHHPDVSGYETTDIMKAINLEFSVLGETLSRESKFYDSEAGFNDLYKEQIEVLIKLKGIKIELCGNWLWVTGDTKPIKDTLKQMKFRFSPKKIAWYFKNYTYRKHSKRKMTLDEIRSYYGSKAYGQREEETGQSTLQLA